MTKDKIKNLKNSEKKDVITPVNKTTTSERIAKRIASSGICSRRDAERLIAEGKVFVNGEKLTTPAFLVEEKDEIIVNGIALKKKETARLWCYHKPVGLLTTHKDPKGRPTVFENLPKFIIIIIS